MFRECDAQKAYGSCDDSMPVQLVQSGRSHSQRLCGVQGPIASHIASESLSLDSQRLPGHKTTRDVLGRLQRQDRQASVAITRSRERELSQPHPQRCLILCSALVSMGASRPAGDAKSASLADAQLRLKAVNLPTPLGWPQSFFRSTSCSICLSKVRSATRPFRRRFSSSSCLISLGAISPNFFFHR